MKADDDGGVVAGRLGRPLTAMHNERSARKSVLGNPSNCTKEHGPTKKKSNQDPTDLDQT